MRRQPRLTSGDEYDVKFIVMFTAGFVVVAGAILLAGYGVLTVTGVLGESNAAIVPTVTPTPTPQPTAQSTVKPGPTATAVPVTPTPAPTVTPVPSPYKLQVSLDESQAPSMIYIVIFSLKQGSQPLDMNHTTISVRNGDTVYCNYNFNEAYYWLDGQWSDSNGDNRLDPTGESISFRISDYSLKIPLDIETRLTLSLDGTTLVSFTLPSLQNPPNLPGESPDPGDQTVHQNPDNIVRWY